MRSLWAAAACTLLPALLAAGEPKSQARPPKDDADLRRWLENMVVYHQFSTEEVQAATGLAPAAIEAARRRFHLEPGGGPPRKPNDPILVLPYPGGRHPRLGFLDGAIDPQRDTKFSVFLPWDPKSYVVVDLPEAIWSQHGLLYLAHTHVPTIWTKQHRALDPLEWETLEGGGLRSERVLPNGVRFGAEVRPEPGVVRMELWLTNGSDETLRDLRVQNCVMLKGAAEFAQQTNENKVFRRPFVACRSPAGNRWIVTAWTPCHRPWGNPPCPCLHSDPKFPDCPPGQTRRLRGWLSFYQGTAIEAEMDRIAGLGWLNGATP